MTPKIPNLLLLVATLVSAIAAALVERQIENTMASIEYSRPGNINSILQLDHTLDSLEQKLQAVLDSTQNAEREQGWRMARHSFDILWGAVNVFTPGRLGLRETSEEAQYLENEAFNYIEKFDLLFSNTSVPETEVLRNSLKGARHVSANLHPVGLALFRQASQFEDDLEVKLKRLYRYLLIAGLMLFVTGSLLIIQLYLSNKRSQLLFNDAENSRHQLADVVDQLRSGKLEKKAKDSFLAAASHDLRQPLHALGLFVNALDNKVSTPEGVAILEKVRQSTEALNSLFNSLLDLSKLDAGVVEIDLDHFNVATLFQSLEEEFSQTAIQRSLELSLSHDNQIVYTDYFLLSRVVRNLIDNAIVHTESGEVIVYCFDDRGEVKISVMDTGPGIPEQEQKSIFSEYYQLHNPERDRSKGLGLGLSIVKRLTELLDIDLQLDSVLGEGTRITMTVPAGDAAMYAENFVTEPFAGERVDLHGTILLVIDDDQTVREGMELVMRDSNCMVIAAESAESARDILVREDYVPDLILADYRLREGRTGIEAIELVRDEMNADIPAIIITGDTSPERVRLAAESGLTLMHKPVVPDEIIKFIQSMVKPVAGPDKSIISSA